MAGRIVHKIDFQKLMSAPVRSSSAHFLLHYVASAPHDPRTRRLDATAANLSTELSEAGTGSVDNYRPGVFAGAMMPKRHARRAVTRNLLRRQVHLAVARHETELPRGLWLVRLRRGFERAEFASARSPKLAEAVRTELDELLGKVATAAPAIAAAAQRIR